MNREMRRKLNKQNKTKFTKEEFDYMVALERIKNGVLDLSDLTGAGSYVHIDNEELAPNGTAVKLNFDSLEYRVKNVDKTNEYFRNWVAEAAKDKNKIYHITREGAKQSLVCLEEDDREVELDGKTVKAPKVLFDLYSDLLVEYNGKWVLLGSVDENTFKDYVSVRVPAPKSEAEEENKNEENK